MKCGPTTRPSEAAWNRNGGGRARVAGYRASPCRDCVWQVTVLQAQAAPLYGALEMNPGGEAAPKDPAVLPGGAGNTPDHAASPGISTFLPQELQVNPAKESESPNTFLREPPVFPGSMARILSSEFLTPPYHLALQALSFSRALK